MFKYLLLLYNREISTMTPNISLWLIFVPFYNHLLGCSFEEYIVTVIMLETMAV
jgi:hypothetical protein